MTDNIAYQYFAHLEDTTLQRHLTSFYLLVIWLMIVCIKHETSSSNWSVSVILLYNYWALQIITKYIYTERPLPPINGSNHTFLHQLGKPSFFLRSPFLTCLQFTLYFSTKTYHINILSVTTQSALFQSHL